MYYSSVIGCSQLPSIFCGSVADFYWCCFW